MCILPRAEGSSLVLPSGRMGSSRVCVAEAAWAALVARAHPRQWKCLLMWISLPESSALAPAAVLDGLESGVYRDADLLCKASRRQLPAALSEASTLAGRRRDAALGGFKLSFTSNNQRVGRVLVSGCGGTLFLSSLRICVVLVLRERELIGKQAAEMELLR